MPQGNHYALIIGNTQYQDLCQLAAPEVDVRAMARVLGDQDIGDFKTTILLNKDSRSLNLGIQQFFSSAKPDDTVLFYFSGHGVLNDHGELFLATSDTREKWPDATSTALRFVLDMSERSFAERKILILDCCYSGTATESIGTKGKSETLWEPKTEEPGKGVVILAASAARQAAFETLKSEKVRRNTPSIFTRHLVEGLETGDAAKEDEPYISILDLFEYTERRMKQVGAKHQPQCKLAGAQGPIHIHIAKNIKHWKFLWPEPLRGLLVSSLPRDQQVAIDMLGVIAAGRDKDLAKRAIEGLKRLSLGEHAEVREKARVTLAELGITPPQLPLKLRISSILKVLSQGLLDAVDRKPWWLVTLVATLVSIWVTSLNLSLLLAFLVGACAVISALVSFICFFVSLAQYMFLDSKNAARLESSALFVLFSVICCTGFIAFQTDNINEAVQRVFSVRRIEIPQLIIVRPPESPAPRPRLSWTKRLENWFTIRDRDDAIRVFFIAFAALGGLTGLVTAKESYMAGLFLGATIGGIVGTLIGSIVSAAMSIGSSLPRIFP